MSTATGPEGGARPGSGRPVIGLVASPGRTAALRPLVAALARRVEVRAVGRTERVDAVLATDGAALARLAGSVRPGVPRAVVDGEVLRVTAAEAGDAALAWPRPAAGGVVTSDLPPLAPHVRARWRRRLGLAPDLVVDTVALRPVDVPTALAVAAAAVVEPRHVPVALALGCPTVTTAAGAAAVGAVDGDHLVVGERPDAVALAADEHRAARLSRRARDRAETHLDPDRAACRLLEIWGLGAPDVVDVAARTRARLDELGAAPGSRPIRRAAEALALFAPEPSGAV